MAMGLARREELELHCRAALRGCEPLAQGLAIRYPQLV